MRKQFYIVLIALVSFSLLQSCAFDPKKPGRIYMPDMTYSNALETYSASDIPNEEGLKISARKPVHGTIPRGWIPADERIRTNDAYLMSFMSKEYFTHDPAKWEPEYAMAAASLKDPLEYTDENKSAGKHLYETHCINCHGALGNGQGNLIVLEDGSDGPYTAIPPDYKKRLAEIKDGNIFYSVSYGKGQMGGYGYSLNVTERWQVIHYIKSLAGIEGDATGAAAKPGQDNSTDGMTKQQIADKAAKEAAASAKPTKKI